MRCSHGTFKVTDSKRRRRSPCFAGDGERGASGAAGCVAVGALRTAAPTWVRPRARPESESGQREIGQSEIGQSEIGSW